MCTARRCSVVDSDLALLMILVTIQNTTFGGIQGFSKKPSTPWYDDSGNFAGIVHQERNWTYILVQGAGHEVPEYQPGFVSFFLRLVFPAGFLRPYRPL